MSPAAWATLMVVARATARSREERVRVRAVLLSDRHKTGVRWKYVIDCPSWCACRKN